MLNSRTCCKVAAKAADSKKAENIIILDMRETIGITDYFVICSGKTDRQVDAIVESIEKNLRSKKTKPYRIEGKKNSGWILIDYLDFIVHVFREERRDFYRLENLWKHAPRISWHG